VKFYQFPQYGVYRKGDIYIQYFMDRNWSSIPSLSGLKKWSLISYLWGRTATFSSDFPPCTWNACCPILQSLQNALIPCTVSTAPEHLVWESLWTWRMKHFLH
jgi:hypothetical protein